MNRREAMETLYEVINSGVIRDNIEDSLVDISNKICEDKVTDEDIDKFHEIINHLVASEVFYSDLLVDLAKVEKHLREKDFDKCRYSMDNEFYWRYCEGCKFLRFAR